MTILAILTLILAVGAYSISQLQQHHKLKGQSDYNNFHSFWGVNSWNRKYKLPRQAAPLNWYYKYIARVKYKERWFTSTNLTVMFTDGYHASQAVSFLCLALSLSLFSGYGFLWFWIGIVGVHATVYRLLSK